MSFILDALKKSESDRQRQSGPALYEVKVVPPKSRFPLWAVALSLLLGVNLAIGGWLMLRHPSAADAAQAAQQAEGARPIAANAASPAATHVEPAPQQQSGTNTQPNTAGVAPPPAPGPITSGTQLTASPAAPPRSSTPVPTSTMSADSGPQGSTGTGTANPDDYAPATEPGQPSGPPGHVKRATASGYVLYQDAELIPGANLPQLRLDLHVYAPKPQDRFCLINMHRLREGESLPEGVRVDTITPDGVVMSHNGLTFLLPRE